MHIYFSLRAPVMYSAGTRIWQAKHCFKKKERRGLKETNALLKYWFPNVIFVAQRDCDLATASKTGFVIQGGPE